MSAQIDDRIQHRYSEDEVLRQIEQAVLDQRLPPGTKLKEVQLANLFGVKRGTIRKVLTPRRHFPTDEAAMKVMYLAIQNRQKRWTKPVQSWNQALQHFSIHFEGRVPIN